MNKCKIEKRLQTNMIQGNGSNRGEQCSGVGAVVEIPISILSCLQKLCFPRTLEGFVVASPSCSSFAKPGTRIATEEIVRFKPRSSSEGVSWVVLGIGTFHRQLYSPGLSVHTTLLWLKPPPQRATLPAPHSLWQRSVLTRLHTRWTSSGHT